MSAMKFDPARLPASDEMGFFMHPDVPGETESDNVAIMLRKMGFEHVAALMSYDEPDLYEEWIENEKGTAVLRWVPIPPTGDGWTLVAKFDTEYGPCALFVRAVTHTPDGSSVLDLEATR